MSSSLALQVRRRTSGRNSIGAIVHGIELTPLRKTSLLSRRFGARPNVRKASTDFVEGLCGHGRAAGHSSDAHVDVMPSKRAREQAAARPARRAQLVEYPYCEPKAAGMPGFCYPKSLNGLTVHEPWSRGRGGPLGDRRNHTTACQYHNDGCSQWDQEWAEEHGFLVSAAEGPAWLEAGGFKRD